MITINPWFWTAHGKHPVAKDFLSIGPNLPATQAFAQWVDAGFNALARDKQTDRPYSWRFWAITANRDQLICGLLRGSCDGVGRIYPLLLMGTGSLPGWEKHWQFLPLVFDPLWRRLEGLASHKFRDLDQFREELAKVGAPEPLNFVSGQAAAVSMDRLAGFPPPCPPPGSIGVTATAASEGVAFIPLEATSNEELQGLLKSWLSAIKGDNSASPSAVFIGGLPDHTCLAVFRQALGMDHFARLWTVAPPSPGEC